MLVCLSFVVLVCRGTEWAASQPGRFNLVKQPPDAHSVRGWVGPRVGLGGAGVASVGN